MKKSKTCGDCEWFTVHGDGKGFCTFYPKWEPKSDITEQCSKFEKEKN